MVECDLAKVEVAGSNPVSRSRFLSPPGPFPHRWTFSGRNANVCAGARYPSGKGEVCKTFMRRFDSDPRLQIFLVVRSRSAPHQSRAANVEAVISAMGWLLSEKRALSFAITSNASAT